MVKVKSKRSVKKQKGGAGILDNEVARCLCNSSKNREEIVDYLKSIGHQNMTVQGLNEICSNQSEPQQVIPQPQQGIVTDMPKPQPQPQQGIVDIPQPQQSILEVDICEEDISKFVSNLQDPMYRASLTKLKKINEHLLSIIQKKGTIWSPDDKKMFCSKFKIWLSTNDICDDINSAEELERYMQCKTSNILDSIQKDLNIIKSILDGKTLTPKQKQYICNAVSYCVQINIESPALIIEQGVAQQGIPVREVQLGGKRKH
jgi:hypothetical protein